MAYALSPFDLVPDFVPVLDYVDDLIIVLAGIALAVGPVDGKLYVGFISSGQIMRITNPRADPVEMSVVIVALTQDQRGINASIGFIGSDLYLPEHGAATVIKNPPATR